MLPRPSSLETAYREGFAPYAHGALELGASANERGGLIVVRARNRWEIILATEDVKVLAAYVDTFPSAAIALLEWLRCAETADILTGIENHLVKMAGSSHALSLAALPNSRAGTYVPQKAKADR